MKGILLVDKPPGMTSHDVVDQIRRAAQMRRIGHTGTLDPAATGLLILCLGAATRLSEFLTGLDKVYEGAMRLGVTTDSYDMDGTVTEERPVPELSEQDIQQVFDSFTGDIMQTPPMVSAVKIGGERLYKKARKGETVERKPRPVTVREFTLLGLNAPDVAFRVRCTRGTYARALCHDVGQVLGCGGVLASLRRTWVGQHSVEASSPVDAFSSPEDVAARLLPMEQALDMPEIIVTDQGRQMVKSGNPLTRAHMVGPCPVTEGWVQVKAKSGELVALGDVWAGPTAILVRPKRVLSSD